MKGKIAATSVMYRGISSLKRAALLFDGFCISNHRSIETRRGRGTIFSDQDFAEFDYLNSIGLLLEPPPDSSGFEPVMMDGIEDDIREIASTIPKDLTGDELSKAPDGLTWDAVNKINDLSCRILLRRISWMYSTDTTPLLCAPPVQREMKDSTTVYRIALDCLPVPDESCSWEDILAFRQEYAREEWALRRFLKSITTKASTEAEVRDDIEWSINEYRQAMDLHKMKRSLSRLETYVVLPAEIAESLVKFNWSNIAKGLLSVRKRKIEAIEAERNSPGKECAYVFHAQERFDRNRARNEGLSDVDLSTPA